MALFLDRFVMEIGLDASKFAKGQREATDSFRKTREAAVKDGQSIEKAVDKAADSVIRLARGFAALFAIFTGGRAFKDFTSDISQADAAMGRLATRIGTTPGAIAALDNAVRRAGGAAGAGAGSFDRLAQSINEIRLTGNSSILPWLARLQAAGGKQINLNKELSETFADMAENAKALADKNGVSQATYVLEQAGVDKDTAALLVKGREAYNRALARSRELGVVNKADADAAQRLWQTYEEVSDRVTQVGRSIATALTPTIVDLLRRMEEWIARNKEWIQTNIVETIKQFAELLKSIPWGEIADGIKTFVTYANAAAQAVGGWANAVKILFALWLGDKFLKVLANIGLLRVALLGGGGFGGGLLGGILGLGAGVAAGSTIAQLPGQVAKGNVDPATGGALDTNPMGDIAKGNSGAIGRWWRRTMPRWLGGGSEAGAGGGGEPGVRGRPSLLNSGGASPEVVSYIRERAAALGIDPDTAVAVANTEGLRGYRLDGLRDRGGDQGTSFGPYQLHYRSNIPGLTNAGMGDDFTAATGKHASDKSTWKEQVDFALRHAAKHGWGNWHGARNNGISNWAGIGGRAGVGAAAPAGTLAGSKEVTGGIHPLGGGGRFTSDFGFRTHPIHGDVRMHKGIDLAAPGGTNVQAMAPGTISLERSGDITVRHADGSSTTYRHVVPSVKEGDQVAAGQIIAQIRARDPRATGPHLHFEARNAKGGLIDPKTLLAPRSPIAPRPIPEAGAIPGRSAQWWRGSPNAMAYASQARDAQAAQMARISNDNRSSRSTTNTTHVGSVTVQTAATDANGITRDMEDALKRRSLAAAANYGQA
ncbi:M23 family metallopeptidase [Methylobacterium nonmethylotrophicum]|uniref:M23 family metallopeptidase n=1 Tax=Methylobacterium nonmethylotrophicum TaxID=1141884 RepID=A0A4Z0NFF8_9HYPH|nr:M23 family metallopeptidase [Methylobacterium nonmethylotrophicum]TGD94911.1 M23 family metallopeptidase [Methylobacterium nonmethylotrophicum]